MPENTILLFWFTDDEDAQEPIAFDEEENEIPTTVFTGFKDNSKRGIRAEFLENEAELSGSDVNSDDDEGEGSADDMEEEEGDREYFDSNELRDQVGKAHLRSLLDSDKREVRLLQEMYLEDGELHGEGRTRQFRWKNLDKSMIEDERKAFSDEEEGSDDNGDDRGVEEAEGRAREISTGTARQVTFSIFSFCFNQQLAETDLYEVESWPSVQKLPKEDAGSGHRKPLAPVAPVQVATKVGTNFNIFLKKLKDLTCAHEYAVAVSNRFNVLGALEDPVELWDTFKRETLQAAKECIGERLRSRRGFVSTRRWRISRLVAVPCWEPGPAQGSVMLD
ncbi:Claspin [Chionoecetes opilio]|uniref:Claspin n=1 Tax=Chionoecetes opilio TaxID=41210 RepID=A0A8J4Y712_CHIOP|nr:Claspin [Chionoecetes opilio]